uniref:hypothetical protein n=1 Tax=uncultured Bacteroides sp. TaxID=162156 RepID=UPI0026370BF1
MDYLKFELDKSLMDRFIETHFDKIKIQILYGPFGEGATLESDQNIRDIREEWFADDSVKLDYANIRKRLKWKLNDSPQIDGDIKDAIKIVFASLNSVNVPDSLKSVSSIFTDMVRLSVNEEHTVTTYSKYRTCINSSEAVLKCILWQLGFIYVEESGKTIQLKGENVQKYSNDKTKDITLDSINCFLSNRFRRFSVTSLQNVSLLCLALKSHRNKETHSTYYTDPERFWRRLI